MPESGALRRWLEARWYGDAPPMVLRPLASLYGAIAALRRGAYGRGWFRRHRAVVPVIVVGNLTVGGTGKTPLVIWLAEQLRAMGHRPGIVLRGYGGNARGPRLITAEADAADVGDEAVLIARRLGCPVAIGARRVEAAKLLGGQGCTVVLADDGLQHLALRPDLTIAVVDGARGFGNGALLPAGPLREPARALHHVGIVVVHGADIRGVARGVDALHMQLDPGPPRALLTGEEESLDVLRRTRPHAIAGIGNPARFFDMLRVLGADPLEHAFPDHHRYRAADLAFDDDRCIVMTEKDAVKCRAFATERMCYLPVAARFPERDAARLLRAVLAVLPQGGSERA
jgi:tetraacyldisaccharide 4'-kinase